MKSSCLQRLCILLVQSMYLRILQILTQIRAIAGFSSQNVDELVQDLKDLGPHLNKHQKRTWGFLLMLKGLIVNYNIGT